MEKIKKYLLSSLILIMLLTFISAEEIEKFEKGDILYRDTWEPGHTALYYRWIVTLDSNDSKSHLIIESVPYRGVHRENLQNFYWEGTFVGAKTVPSISYVQRKIIIRSALMELGDGYSFLWPFKDKGPYTWSCVGLTEHCYECAGFDPVPHDRYPDFKYSYLGGALCPERQYDSSILSFTSGISPEIFFHKAGIIEEGQAVTPSEYKDGKYYLKGVVNIKFYASDGVQGSGLIRAELWLGEPDDTPDKLPGKRIFKDETKYDVDHIYVGSFDTTIAEHGEYNLFAKVFDQSGNYNIVSIPIVIKKGAVFKDKDNWDGKQIWYGIGTYWDAGKYINSKSKYYKEDRCQIGNLGNGYLCGEFLGEPITREFGYNVNFIRCIRTPIIGYNEFGPIYDPEWINLINTSPDPYKDSYKYLLNKTPIFARGLPYEIGGGYIVSDACGQFYTGDMRGYPGDEVLTTRHFLQFPVKEDRTIFKITTDHKGCSSYGNLEYHPFYVGVGIFNSDIDITIEPEYTEETGLKDLFYQASDNVGIYPADGIIVEKGIFKDLKPEIAQKYNKDKKFIYISVKKTKGGNSLGDMEDLSHNEEGTFDKWGEFCRFGRTHYLDIPVAFISNGGRLTFHYSKKAYWISPYFNIDPINRKDDKIIIKDVIKDGSVRFYIRFENYGKEKIYVDEDEYKFGWISLGELEDKVIDGKDLGYTNWQRFQICLEFLTEESKVHKFEIILNER